jgi:DNA-binding transcriptional ArsR family regulator
MHTDDPTPDQVFATLSNARRRMVLSYLRTHDPPVTVDELSEQIAAAEHDVEPGSVTQRQRKRAYVSVYQTHLPKLAQMGFVDYDEEAGLVRSTDRADTIDPYLTRPTDEPYPWTMHYRTLAIGGGTLYWLTSLDAPVFGAVPASVIALGLGAALGVSALVHRRRRQRRRRELPIELAVESPAAGPTDR